MFEKTIAWLAAKGETGKQDDAGFDEQEVEELANILKWIVYAPPALRKAFEQRDVMITRSDFYSNIPTVAEIEQSATDTPIDFDAIFADAAALKSLLIELTEYSAEFTPPMTATSPDTFGWLAGGYSYSDAMSYYAMIRKFRPKAILELGCGTSTLVARQALDKNGEGWLTCIEPYPNDMLKGLSDITLHEARAQSITIEMINDTLRDGDFLFIDTTHTVKHNSDCLHVYLRLLPYIAHDIYVHAHDIYLPKAYPNHLMLEHQTHWTEQYLLYAYMLDNPRVRSVYGSAYHSVVNDDLLKAFMHGRYQHGGSAFWFTQSKAK